MKLSGKDIAEKIYSNLQKRVEKLQEKNITPHLVVFLIGDNPASVAYVKQKQKKGEEIGCKVTVLRLEQTITNKELEEKLKLLNNDPYVHGILIQRPVPEHIDIERLEQLTNPEKDIDGFHPDSPYTFPIPLAVMKILEEVYSLQNQRGVTETKGLPSARSPLKLASLRTSTTGKSFWQDPEPKNWLQSKIIVISGKGPTGGGPIITYLKQLSLNPHVIDSKTPDPEAVFKQADIIISAVGKENILKPHMIKKDAILIGVGILRGTDGKLHGDYDEHAIENTASYYTPTPGGVGPVNVAMLISNLLTATEKQTKTTT